MKKLHTILAVILITATTFAQAPEKMSYQVVVRDASGALVREQLVGIEIEILYSQYGGTAYFETHFVNTNANGLVTLEIGTGGTGNVFNDFSAIQWDTIDGNWIYTKIDPLGGVNYTITNISQLLSVPYALHANNGMPSSGNIGEILYWDGSSWSPIPQGTLGQVLTWGNTGPVWQTSPAVGDFMEGGIVFWVDPTDNNHGLVCSIENLTEDINWSNGTDGYTNEVATDAKYLGIGRGSYNTDIIIDILGEPITNYAAGLARSYGGGGYTDWFLPSKGELIQIAINYDVISAASIENGGEALSYDIYWTSSEINFTDEYCCNGECVILLEDKNGAWIQYLFPGIGNIGVQFPSTKSNLYSPAKVRAVRAF